MSVDDATINAVAARLRQLAEAATEGPWETWDDHDANLVKVIGSPDGPCVASVGQITWDYARPDAEYIAAADPTTVLALLDEIARLRALAEGGWLKDPADRALTPTDQAVLDAAEAAADADLDDDMSDCPYYQRGEPGADANGTCSYGCYDEPRCQTCIPRDGWPLENLRLAVRARRAAVGGSVPADPPEAKLLAEVLDQVTDWRVSWWREPYEGWDGSLHRLECEQHCYGCDPLNVTRAQVEAMRRNGIEVAERPSAGPQEAKP